MDETNVLYVTTASGGILHTTIPVAVALDKREAMKLAEQWVQQYGIYDVGHYELHVYTVPKEFTAFNKEVVAVSIEQAFINLLKEATSPDEIYWHTLDGKPLTAKDLINHIENNTEIGRQYISDSLRVLRDWFRRKTHNTLPTKPVYTQLEIPGLELLG